MVYVIFWICFTYLICRLLIAAGFRFSVLLFDVLYFLIVSVLDRSLFHLFIWIFNQHSSIHAITFCPTFSKYKFKCRSYSFLIPLPSKVKWWGNGGTFIILNLPSFKVHKFRLCRGGGGGGVGEFFAII